VRDLSRIVIGARERLGSKVASPMDFSVIYSSASLFSIVNRLPDAAFDG